MDQGQLLSGGFADPATDAARAFRACLEAMARPGRAHEISGAAPPAPMSEAAGAVLLTLVDASTGLYLAPSHDLPELRQWIAFHCGAPIVGAAQAEFALGTWEALQPVTQFAIGTAEYPDRSATLIVEMPASAPPNVRLTGPGIQVSHVVHLPEIEAFQRNAARFPLGFDCYFTHDRALFGLPRSTRVEAL